MARHGALLGSPGVPELRTEEFEAHARIWENVFRRLNAMDVEVEKASDAVLERPPKWWAEQLPAIEAAILAERAKNPARPEVEDEIPVAREDAERLSRRCDLCTGSGWAEVWHREFTGQPVIERTASDGSTYRINARFRLACKCPLGKWLLRANERSAQAVEGEYERTRRLREVDAMRGIDRVLAGHTDYMVFDPRAAAVKDESEVEWEEVA